MRYRGICKYDVLYEVAKGKTVFVCDKLNAIVQIVNNMAFADVAILFMDADEDTYRYEFWYNESEEQGC